MIVYGMFGHGSTLASKLYQAVENETSLPPPNAYKDKFVMFRAGVEGPQLPVNPAPVVQKPIQARALPALTEAERAEFFDAAAQINPRVKTEAKRCAEQHEYIAKVDKLKSQLSSLHQRDPIELYYAFIDNASKTIRELPLHVLTRSHYARSVLRMVKLECLRAYEIFKKRDPCSQSTVFEDLADSIGALLSRATMKALRGERE